MFFLFYFELLVDLWMMDSFGSVMSEVSLPYHDTLVISSCGEHEVVIMAEPDACYVTGMSSIAFMFLLRYYTWVLE
jgi:hypothetical protein